MTRRKATKSDTAEPTSGLTSAQEQAAGLLTGGSTVTDAASTIGVHRSTVHAWVKMPAFQVLMSEMRRDVLRSSADLIRSNLGKAARVVASILDDSKANDRDKLTAAGIAYKVAGSAVPALEVPAEPDPLTLDVLAVGTARRAHSMAGGFFLSMDDTRTPGMAWAKAGLDRASYANLRAFGDDLEGAAAYCEGLLAEWRTVIDDDALQNPGAEIAGRLPQSK